MSDIAIEVRNAVKAFGQGGTAVRALDDVSVDIRKGEFFTLLGPSGCGKTTLLRLIAGFESPTSGQIRLDGQDITHLPPNKRPVNTVFQSYALFPHLTVLQNVGFALQMLGKPKAEVEETARRMLDSDRGATLRRGAARTWGYASCCRRSRSRRAPIATLDDAMRAHIVRALGLARGRVEGRGGAADLLGVNPHTLRGKMRRLKIEWSRYRD